MAELVPNIARAYWRVLGSIVSCLVVVVVGVVWRAIARDTPLWVDDTDDDTRGWWPGLFWVLYGVAAAVATAVLHNSPAPSWRIEAAIGAAVLGVLPIYWACPWSRPREDRLIYKRAATPDAPSPGIAWRWGRRKPPSANATQKK
jgi:hypothetical protein